MLRVLQFLRSVGQKCFLRFGLHCATHQIRVILISCVVITSLFYPALAIYSSSQTLSSLVDAFGSRNSVSGFPAYSDLEDIWTGHDALKVHQDSVSRVKCGAARALRVERLLVRNPVAGDAGAVNHHLLLFTLALEARLNSGLLAGDRPCLKKDDGQCFVISPLLFWNNDRDALLADADVLKTLGASDNVTIGDITITPHMVLAGRASSVHRAGASPFDFATFLALTYFFPESDCLSTSEHSSWKQTVQSALSHDIDVNFHLQGPSLSALEYDPGHSYGLTGTCLATFVNLAYLSFFVYVAWSVRQMDAVHSRLGVTFTALVEITVSTITSLSVCALVGFRITMVPWELLPIVIVFVGAENMFNLVDAVCRTSVTIPVKRRVAEGLSRAGTSNTLKVLTYNTILGLIAAFSGGAVRQFCVFAIVVLVAHWFLAHTFFIAVLSIDIQRLELEELLRHDPTVVTSVPKKPETVEILPTTRWRRLMKSAQTLLKGRAATNISLLMLLAIAGTLYYITYFSLSAHDSRLHSTSAATVPWAKNPISAVPPHYTTAWNIWRKLNPSQHPLLHLRIEQPAIITPLPSSNLPDQLQDARFLSLRPYIRLIFWLLKIMVLPIAGTTGMLWFLLLYLLKDADLLEAQRNRDGPNSAQFDASANGFEGRVSLSALPRAFASDIELIVSSKDGQTVLSVGLNDELMVWLASSSSVVTIDIKEALSAIEPPSTATMITSVAIDEHGEYLAIGTKMGNIAVWMVEDKTVRFLRSWCPEESGAGITDLRCFRAPSSVPKKPPTPDSSPQARTLHHHITIIAAFDNGTVIKWALGDVPVWSYVMPRHPAPALKALLSLTSPDDTLVVTFVFEDGYVELVGAQKGEPPIGHSCFQASSLNDPVAEIYLSRLKFGGNIKAIMAVTTESGKLSLWDLISQERICDIGCDLKPAQPRIIQGHREACRTCGHLPLESFFVAFAIEQNIELYQFLLYDQIRYCACSSNLRKHSSHENISHSFRGETTALQSSDALRSRVPPVHENNSFPVSGHGIYPRRASESARRSSEIVMVPFPGEDPESIHILGTNVLKPQAQLASSSLWKNHSLVHLGGIPCGKGKWDLACQKIVGVRRKERRKEQKTSGPNNGQPPPISGFPISTLDRWEIWTFDPATLHMQASLLSAIMSKEVGISASIQALHVPRMPFTQVSPLVVTSSHVFAGFGNTIGLFTFSDP